jgi:hypothetical protein
MALNTEQIDLVQTKFGGFVLHQIEDQGLEVMEPLAKVQWE